MPVRLPPLTDRASRILLEGLVDYAGLFAPAALAMNDLGEIRLRVSKPLYYDGYGVNRLTGSFILIEQGTNATVAAGMLLPSHEVVKPENGDFMI